MMNYLEHNSIYVVLVIVLIIWAGLATYLTAIDSRLKKISKIVENYDDKQ